MYLVTLMIGHTVKIYMLMRLVGVLIVVMVVQILGLMVTGFMIRRTMICIV